MKKMIYSNMEPVKPVADWQRVHGDYKTEKIVIDGKRYTDITKLLLEPEEYDVLHRSYEEE